MHELEWLADRRPETEPPDELTTWAARAALLAHARSASRPARRSRLAFAPLAAALAAALVVAAGLLPSGDGHRAALPTEPQAQAAIVTLSRHLQQAPAPPGDA